MKPTTGYYCDDCEDETQVIDNGEIVTCPTCKGDPKGYHYQELVAREEAEAEAREERRYAQMDRSDWDDQNADHAYEWSKDK